jgi:hypothetical protein
MSQQTEQAAHSAATLSRATQQVPARNAGTERDAEVDRLHQRQVSLGSTIAELRTAADSSGLAMERGAPVPGVVSSVSLLAFMALTLLI